MALESNCITVAWQSMRTLPKNASAQLEALELYAIAIIIRFSSGGIYKT